MNKNECHEKLISTLDILREGADWQQFMQTVEDLIPDILSRGRATKEMIDGCFIGELGFTSWTQYIETPQSSGGLGWKSNGWKGYNRAWGFCKDNDWLLETGMKPGTINAFIAKCKKLEIDIPATLEEYENLIQQWKDEKDQASMEEQEQPMVDGFPPRLTFWQWLTYWF